MPTKKTSCDRVQRSVAGPTPEDIVESIRTEYGLLRPKAGKAQPSDSAPASPRPKPNEVTS